MRSHIGNILRLPNSDVVYQSVLENAFGKYYGELVVTYFKDLGDQSGISWGDLLESEKRWGDAIREACAGFVSPTYVLSAWQERVATAIYSAGDDTAEAFRAVEAGQVHAHTHTNKHIHANTTHTRTPVNIIDVHVR